EVPLPAPGRISECVQPSPVGRHQHEHHKPVVWTGDQCERVPHDPGWNPLRFLKTPVTFWYCAPRSPACPSTQGKAAWRYSVNSLACPAGYKRASPDHPSRSCWAVAEAVACLAPDVRLALVEARAHRTPDTPVPAPPWVEVVEGPPWLAAIPSQLAAALPSAHSPAGIRWRSL